MAVLPFKDDADFSKHNDQVFEDHAQDIKDFVTRFEALEHEKQDIQSDQRDLLTVMKAKGFNVKALRRVLAERRRDQGELAEEKEVAQLYLDLLRGA